MATNFLTLLYMFFHQITKAYVRVLREIKGCLKESNVIMSLMLKK